MKVTGIVFVFALLVFQLGCTNKPKPKIEQITYQSKIFLENSLIDYLNKSEGLQSKDSLKFTNALISKTC